MSLELILTMPRSNLAIVAAARSKSTDPQKGIEESNVEQSAFKRATFTENSVPPCGLTLTPYYEPSDGNPFFDNQLCDICKGSGYDPAAKAALSHLLVDDQSAKGMRVYRF